MKIEKGIPLPPNRNKSHPYFQEMEVGDSVKFEGTDNVGRALCSYWGRKLCRKFVLRSYEESYRIWRTA